MFVKTVKLKKIGKVLFVILCALIIVLAAVYAFNRIMEPKGITLAGESEQAAFLKELGWETSPAPIDVRTVVIPEEWNDVYTEYNNLQLAQGFDLDDFRGKAAEIYTYEIYNYGDSRPNIIANLVICNDRLIAGDICCTELGGFMQGLMKVDS